MKYFYFYLILVFSFIYIQNQSQENIRIFNDEKNYDKPYREYIVFKNEIFALKLTVNGGTGFYWYHLNDSLSTEPKIIQYLNKTYNLGIEKIRIKQTTELPEASEASITPKIIEEHPPIMGGPEVYYEIYKALEVTDQPAFFHLILSRSWYNFSEYYSEQYIYIWVCDEIYKDQCINNDTMKCVYDKENKTYTSKILCDKVENPSESSCDNAVTFTPSLTKCIYNSTKEKCVEEEKFCNEINNGAIKSICSNAKVSNENNICILDEEKNSCKENGNNNIKNINLLLYILYSSLLI